MTEKQLHQFRKKLLTWFKKNQRKLPWRDAKNPYHIWVVEVMLQQTQVKKVLEYYQKFLERFPDVKALAKADLQQVLKAWEGMGYYARARNLHKAAQFIMTKNGAEIPDNYDEFKRLPGAGDYITAAVLSQAFNAPYAVVDGNVKRVLSRIFLIEKPVPVNSSASNKIFKEKADLLLDQRASGVFNQAMMELGAIVCRPSNPKCDDCPVSAFCQANKTNQQTKFPVTVQARSIPEFHIAVGVIHKEGHILITQRHLEGLLGGLWEFPGGKVNLGESTKQACIRTIKQRTNLEVEVNSFVTRVNHAYTHFRIIVDVFNCRFKSGTVVLNGHSDYRWISIEEIDKFPFHAAIHKFIPQLKQNTNWNFQ
ncbi:MAG: A/G-specific adenine glycosylase [bacterium]|nr:MAG: A/G-specific adenine glycosylase [bacterium]